MKRIVDLLCAILLGIIVSAASATAESGIPVRCTFAQPSEDEYTAQTWQMQYVDYTKALANEALPLFDPSVQVEAHRDLLLYQSGTRQPQFSHTPTYISSAFTADPAASGILTALGWERFSLMTAIRLDEYYDYARLCARGTPWPPTLEAYAEKEKFPKDAMSQIYVFWQTIDGKPVFPESQRVKGDNEPLYASLICDSRQSYHCAMIGKLLCPVEPLASTACTVSPSQSAELAAAYAADRWKHVSLVSGDVQITVDTVRLGYWVDAACVAHPGWLTHAWGCMTSSGENVAIVDSWLIIDFQTGSLLY